MTTLKYTLEQVRSRQVARLETVGLPNAWWPLPAGNDCVAFQLYNLGIRSRTDLDSKYISILHFRDAYKWPEVQMGDAQAGDLVCENWSAPIGPDAEHIEYIYAIDHDAKTITTISANTGPKAGVPVPRGAWKKTRPLDGHFLFAIRPPYKTATASNGRKNEVRAVATYLNSLHLGWSSAAADDGIEGPIYWWLVQTWGRKNGIYGSTYDIDRIPGPQTRRVEAVIYKLAKKG